MKQLVLTFCALLSLTWVSARAEDEFDMGKKHKYINLSIGIYTDESMPEAPEEPKPDGTFRRLVRTQWNRTTKTMRFYPRQVGVGTFIIKDPKTGKVIYEYTLDVKKTDLEKVAREIQGLLATIEGIQVKVLNNKVVVDGEIILPSDMKRIHSVVKQYGAQATSLVTLSPMAQNKVALFIERKINNPEIRVSAVNGKFILEGFANSQGEKDRAYIVAQLYAPDVIIDEAVADKKVLEHKADPIVNLINVRAPPDPEPSKLIQLVIHYVELSKAYSKSFHFQWTPGIVNDQTTVQFSSGGAGQGSTGTTIAGTISNLIPKLNWAKQHGFARVLQSESVLVEDGRQGTLNSVQQIPYQMSSPYGPSTGFADAGLRTTITPRIMSARSDSVNMSISFSVKSLDGNTAAGPQTSSREIQTVVHVRSGQSAAIGGLINGNTDTEYNKPTADQSSNPIISLYASKEFQRNQSQFVVFITPIIKSSASAGSDKIKKKFRLDQ